MAKTLVAWGQAIACIQKDGYTITQSLGGYVFPADVAGKIISSMSFAFSIKVALGDSEYSAFTIDVVSKPARFLSITVDNGKKIVSYSV